MFYHQKNDSSPFKGIFQVFLYPISMLSTTSGNNFNTSLSVYKHTRHVFTVKHTIIVWGNRQHATNAARRRQVAINPEYSYSIPPFPLIEEERWATAAPEVEVWILKWQTAPLHSGSHQQILKHLRRLYWRRPIRRLRLYRFALFTLPS